MPDVDAQMPPWKVAAALAHNLVLAAVVTGLAARGEIDEWTGAVIHESTSVRLAAIHAGDWLVNLLAVAVLVSVWQ